MQGLVASIERVMRESREYAKAMDRYKPQLHSIWSKEDVQSWVSSFSTVIKQTQAAYDVAIEATKNKGQVCVDLQVLLLTCMFVAQQQLNCVAEHGYICIHNVTSVSLMHISVCPVEL